MFHFFSKKHVIYSYGLIKLRKLFAKLIKLKQVPPYGLWVFQISTKSAEGAIPNRAVRKGCYIESLGDMRSERRRGRRPKGKPRTDTYYIH